MPPEHVDFTSMNNNQNNTNINNIRDELLIPSSDDILQKQTVDVSYSSRATETIETVRNEINHIIHGTLSLDTPNPLNPFKALFQILKKYSRFIGPVLMVSVYYMYPGNY